MSWELRFPDPVPVPGGKPLLTLRDGAEYVTSLPKQTQHEKRWQNVIHVLIQAADHEGPIEFARLGLMQALYPKPEPVYHSVKKDPVWRNNYKLVRDR